MRSPDAPVPPPPSSSVPSTAVTSPVSESSSTKPVTSSHDWTNAEFNLDSMFNAVGDAEEGEGEGEGELDVSCLPFNSFLSSHI